MAIQPTPPIQLDPSMDNGHQLAFINQNFNNVASVIGQNSFVIVQSGVARLTVSFGNISGPVTNGLDNSQRTTITHNLGFIPFGLFAYSSNSGTSYFPVSDGSTYSMDVGSNYMNYYSHSFIINSTTLTIELIRNYAAAATVTLGTLSGYLDYRYYLLQQSAS